MLVGIASVVVAYLFGSIPFAYLLARLLRGIDIRQVGTGNVGTMNTLRQIGVLPGLAVLALDMAKGVLSVLVARWLGATTLMVFLAGAASVVGHSWPVFLGFRGGKGAATVLGVMLALAPVEFAVSFAVIVLVVLITRSSGFGIGIGLGLLPLLIWLFGGGISLILYSIALPILLVLINTPMFIRDLSRARSLKEYVLPKRPPFWRRK